MNKKFLKNDISNTRHPKCKGYVKTYPIGEIEFGCGYNTIIDCDECKYGGGMKDPEAKCNKSK